MVGGVASVVGGVASVVGGVGSVVGGVGSVVGGVGSVVGGVASVVGGVGSVVGCVASVEGFVDSVGSCGDAVLSLCDGVCPAGGTEAWVGSSLSIDAGSVAALVACVVWNVVSSGSTGVVSAGTFGVAAMRHNTTASSKITNITDSHQNRNLLCIGRITVFSSNGVMQYRQKRALSSMSAPQNGHFFILMSPIHRRKAIR